MEIVMFHEGGLFRESECFKQAIFGFSSVPMISFGDTERICIQFLFSEVWLEQYFSSLMMDA